MDDAILFPYMVWAHTEATRSPWCLSQSGMPTADPDRFAAPGRLDLSHPSADALPRLEARLAGLFGVAPERVLVVAGGASGAMHLAALRWFGPGTRVVSEIPSYEPLRALPRLLGAETVLLERRPESGFALEPGRADDLARGARGPVHVFVTSLHNPSGAAAGPETLAALARTAGRAGGVLVSCEVYTEYLPNERRVHAFACAPNAVSIGSFTKAWGLGPLRLGWLVLGEGLAGERALLQDRMYLTTVDPPTPCLVAGLAALDHVDRLLQPLRRVEAECRPHWERWLRETPGVDAFVPEHGIIAFPRLVGVDDTRAFARWLAAEHGVDVVPGEFFGRAGHVRIGCGVPEATLVEGLARLGRGLAAWRRR